MQTGSTMPIATPNHWFWNGIHRNDALLMQHRFGLRAGLGVPQHEVRHRLVGALLQAGRARELQRHREHVGAAAEEQALAEIENAGIAPRQRDGDAEHAEHEIFGDAG